MSEVNAKVIKCFIVFLSVLIPFSSCFCAPFGSVIEDDFQPSPPAGVSGPSSSARVRRRLMISRGEMNVHVNVNANEIEDKIKRDSEANQIRNDSLLALSLARKEELERINLDLQLAQKMQNEEFLQESREHDFKGEKREELREWERKYFNGPAHPGEQEGASSHIVQVRRCLRGLLGHYQLAQIGSATSIPTVPTVNLSKMIDDPFQCQWFPLSSTEVDEAMSWDELKVRFEGLRNTDNHRRLMTKWFRKLAETRDAGSAQGKQGLNLRLNIIVNSLDALNRDNPGGTILQKAREIIFDGSSACADRAIVSLDKLELHLSLSKAGESPEAMVSIGLGEFKKQLTEIDFLGKLGIEEGLEASLYYQKHLKEYFNLPTQTGDMLFENIGKENGKLSITQAADEAFMAFTVERIGHFFSQWEPWKEFSRNYFKEEFSQIEELMADPAKAEEGMERYNGFAREMALKILEKEGYLTRNPYYQAPEKLKSRVGKIVELPMRGL